MIIHIIHMNLGYEWHQYQHINQNININLNNFIVQSKAMTSERKNKKYLLEFDEDDQFNEETNKANNEKPNPQMMSKSDYMGPEKYNTQKFKAVKMQKSMMNYNQYQKDYQDQINDKQKEQKPEKSKDNVGRRKRRQQKELKPLEIASKRQQININIKNDYQNQRKNSKEFNKIQKKQMQSNLSIQNQSMISLKNQYLQKKQLPSIEVQHQILQEDQIDEIKVEQVPKKQHQGYLKQQQQQIQQNQQQGQQYGQEQNEIANKINKLVNTQVPLQRTLKLLVERETGILVFHPIYDVYFCSDKRYVMSAKKTSNSAAATFVISRNRQNFQQNSPSYLGKVKLSFLGNIGNIFGPGLSPENAMKQMTSARQLLATVVYYNEILSVGSKPRQFKVYYKKPQFSYDSLKGVIPYQDEIPLDKLYEEPTNRDKIMVFQNKMPVWKESVKGYSLNFRGRVNTPSIKNFILDREVDQSGEFEQVMLFGKLEDNKFNMDVSHPISPVIAFGIALTSFGPA